MGAATLPLAPLVPVIVYEQPLRTIPAEARRLYERRTCSLLEAGAFLGFKAKPDPATGEATRPSNAVYARVKAYERRTQAVKASPPYDPNELLPRAGEIAAVKGGEWMVDTRMLVWLRFPQVSPW